LRLYDGDDEGAFTKQNGTNAWNDFLRKNENQCNKYKTIKNVSKTLQHKKQTVYVCNIIKQNVPIMIFNQHRKYKAASNRKPGWDYRSSGYYFITICTQYRQPYFGELVDGSMVLNELGECVVREWENTPNVRPDMNLRLESYVVMPDHFHGVLHVGTNPYNREGIFEGGQFGAQSKNVGSVIRGFKSSITKFARVKVLPFQWQRGYHDRILSLESELPTVNRYILENPMRAWLSQSARPPQ